MKISKVDHMRSGVVIGKGHTEGVLYKSPAQKDKSKQDIEKSVKQLSSRARSLYQIFGDKSVVDGSAKSVYNAFKGYMKNLIAELLKKNEDGVSVDEALKQQMDYLKNLPHKKIFVLENKERTDLENLNIEWKGNDPEEIVELLAYGSLKRSLNRSVSASDGGDAVLIPEVVKKLATAVAAEKGYSNKYKEIPEREIKAFLLALNEDYTKDKQTEGIVKSIENQNVKVQCADVDGQKLLRLSNADSPKKKYIFDFIKEYAINESARPDMLIHFRQLVLLYYCGSETYRQSIGSDDVREWGFGSLEPEEALPFSEDALELYLDNQSRERDSVEYKKTVTEIREVLRNTVAERYRESVREPGLTEADIFWIGYIEEQAEKLLSHTRNLDQVRLSKKYLCKKTAMEWASFIGMKYVDMGKAVFHFAMPQGENIRTATSFGEVLPEYADGITSFDYERIKAEESLNQDLFSAVSFAVGNFDSAARDDDERQKKDKEDILQILDRSKLVLRRDSAKRLLQFYGGQGKWENTDIELYEGVDLTLAFGKELNRIRNATFHYTGKWSENVTAEDAESREIIQEMFKEESARVSYLFRKKYYANNVLMFYSRSDIDGLIESLYAQPVQRPAQIPAFSRILNKAGLKEFNFLKGNPARKLWSSGKDPLSVVGKFENSLLFVLKEVYYYGFLQLPDLKERFMTALDAQNKNPKATENLKKRIKEIDPDNTVSFGELCQGIMTDYTLQNRSMKKLPSEKDKNIEKQIYKHFRTLLYLGIRQAFRNWLMEDKDRFDFLRSPEWNENWAENFSEEDFCSRGGVHVYDGLMKKAGEDMPLLYSWYTLAHFLNQRQLNFLIGSLKNYMTFLKDIDMRASITGSRVDAERTQSQTDLYEPVIEVLDFSKLFCEQITNDLKDYFEDEESYSEYMSRYVAWREGKCPSLKAFCSEPLANNETHPMIGIYYDGGNPIVNRNVILSRMYGNEKLLAACLKNENGLVTKADIEHFYKNEAELLGNTSTKKGKSAQANRKRNVFKEGYCETEEEQKAVREYQNQKNRIELLDLVFYSEIVNDMMSQLRNWCYMRERDLMYCQLGIHYINLRYGDCSARPWLDTLTGNGVNVEKGAILYQILSMYTYELPMYTINADGTASLSNKMKSIGGKIVDFVKGYCHEDIRSDDIIYNWGLCFFENLHEHDAITDFRNSIDHFKYEINLERSIESLYSEMYGRFLRYDTKLQKSVPVIMKNILMKNFIIADLDFITMTNGSGKKTTSIRLRKRISEEGPDPVRSDVLTYRLNRGIDSSYSRKGDEEKAYVEARTSRFVNMVTELLCYQEAEDIEEN